MANPANHTRAVRRDTLRRGDRGGRGVEGSLSNAGVSTDEGGDSAESDSVVGAGNDTIGAVRRAAGGTGEAGEAGEPSWFERAIVSAGEDGAAEGAGIPSTMTTGDAGSFWKASSRAAANALTSTKRCFGSLARAFMTISSIAGESVGILSSNEGGGTSVCFTAISAKAPWNGRVPHSHS